METIGNVFTKGMDNDTLVKFLEEGKYTYALNALLSTKEGEMGVLSTEVSNQLAAELKEGYLYIGSIPTNDNGFIIFSTDEINSEIGIFTPNSKDPYTELINTDCLGFSSTNPIHGIYRIRNGCERIIYFTDRVNSLRVINLDELSFYTDEDGEWDCERMSLSRSYTPPTVSVQLQNTGGALEVGSYQFSIRYIDQDGNSTPWTIFTAPVPISLGEQNGSWYDVKGAYNIKYNTAEKGGTPATSKSIRLTLNNLDPSFSSYEISVAKSLEGLGITTTTAFLPRVSYSGTSSSFTYTGNTSIEIEASIEEVITDKVPIDVVQTVASINSALWLGGVSNKSYNWADFQRAASATDTLMTIESIPAYELEEGNPKTYNYLGFAYDEIEAFGIVYKMKDGSFSPVFHIPGRAAQGQELSLLNVWRKDMDPWVSEDDFNASYATTEADTTTKPYLRHYQVYNTGTKYQFGYWQSTQRYPDIVDCNGNSIWGVDSEGNSLAGKNIRYHRFPDSNSTNMLERKSDNKIYYNKLFPTFVVGTYPHPDVVGHEIVQVKKSQQDTTVKDQGIMSPIFVDLNKKSYYYTPILDNAGDPWRVKGDTRDLSYAFAYFSSKTLSEQLPPEGSYIKLNGVFGLADQSAKKVVVDPAEGKKVNVWTNIDARDNSLLYPLNNEPVIQRKIFARSFVNPRAYQTSPQNSSYGYYNVSLSQGITFFEVADVSIWTNTNAENAAAAWKINTPITPDPFDKGLPRLLVSIKSTLEPFQDLFSLEYIPLQGNWIISPIEIVSIIDTDLTFDIKVPLISFANREKVDSHYSNGLWSGSEYNFSLRTIPTTPCTNGFKDPGPVLTRHQELFNHVMSKVAERQESGAYAFIDLSKVCEEPYFLNKDYNKLSYEKIFYPLPIQYDYCTDCNNTFPNRIFKSRKDNLESYVDNYRVFLANNYTNLDGSGDKINQFVVDKDELYVLTQNYVYAVNTRPQELKTDATTAYIGNASEFVIPPKRLVSTSFSYGGSNQPLSVVSCEYGTSWADTYTGKVYQLRDNVRELSAQGMSAFFEKEMQLQLQYQFKSQLGIDYPFLWQTTSPMGIGIVSAYDPRFKRLLLTKKDYSAKYPLSLSTDKKTEENVIYFENNKFYAYPGGEKTELDLTDTQYFENKCWTISYSFKHEAWSSFHSYVPGFYCNDGNTFYSSKDNILYQHNADTYNSFYGENYPFIVETILNKSPFTDKTFESWTINNTAVKDNESLDKTFDSMWVYNDDSNSTGLVTLQQYNPYLNSSASAAYWRKIKSAYNINSLRILKTGNIYTTDTHSLDKSPVAPTDNNPFFQPRINGNYVLARLYYNNDDSAIKFNLESVQSMITKSTR